MESTSSTRQAKVPFPEPTYKQLPIRDYLYPGPSASSTRYASPPPRQREDIGSVGEPEKRIPFPVPVFHAAYDADAEPKRLIEPFLPAFLANDAQAPRCESPTNVTAESCESGIIPHTETPTRRATVPLSRFATFKFWKRPGVTTSITKQDTAPIAPLKSNDADRLPDSAPQTNSYISALQEFDVASNLELGRLRGSGGFADIYDGQLYMGTKKSRPSGRRKRTADSEWKTVAVKRYRVFLESDKDFKATIDREVRIWSGLNHPNVLPLLGYVTLEGLPALVSEWMDNGALSQYWPKSPAAKVLPMAKGIAGGLAYLHEKGVIHSDLKSDNVLISKDGRPLLCDFGISRLHIENVTVAGTNTLKGNIRWMAFELIRDDRSADPNPKHKFHTKESDVWAYGMVLYELLCGKMPFHHLRTEASIVRVITIDDPWYPLKPTDEEWRDSDSSGLWDTCVECWSRWPSARPTMAELLEELESHQ